MIQKRMELSIKQAYIAMFYFVNSYFAWKQTDDLAVLISACNPYLFEGGMPADLGVWQEWEESVSKITSKKTLTIEEIFRSMLAFLKLYHQEVGYELAWVIEDMESNYNNKELQKSWLECIERGIEEGENLKA